MEEYKYKNVLLVDDSYIDNLINRKIIEKSGFADNIVVIDSPHEAINYMRKCVAEQKNVPEVLFLDIRMPNMSGFEFLKELNDIEGLAQLGIKIYVLSSSLDPEDLKEIAGNQLVSKFIGKPLTNTVLEEI
jgi:CheY-like chemotaxis protein